MDFPAFLLFFILIRTFFSRIHCGKHAILYPPEKSSAKLLLPALNCWFNDRKDGLCYSEVRGSTFIRKNV
jgi:hypothetical protein